MDGSIGDGLGQIIYFLAAVCVISVPLGTWKAVDIAIWCSHHVSFRFVNPRKAPMADKIYIPEHHIEFCKAIARLCREHKMHRVGVTYSPNLDDPWPGDIAMCWEQGRHGAEAGKISITSNVRAVAKLDAV